MPLTLVRDDKQNKEIQQPLCQYKILSRRSTLKLMTLVTQPPF